MFSVELKEDGITAPLANAAALLDDLTPVMESIGEILSTSTKKRFGEGVAPDGSKWAAKSKATLAKYARGPDRVDTRPLFGPSLELSSGIFTESGRDYVEVGSHRIYAAMMQFGGTKAAFPHLWGDIPARPFLGVSEQDRADIGAEIAEAMAGAFGQA